MAPPPTTRTSESLQNQVRALFERQNWGFSVAEGTSALMSQLSGPLGVWALCVQVIEEAGLVIFYSVLPRNVPARRRAAMAKLLTRINYRLSVGSFDMDYEDGEVRSRVTLPVGGRPLDAGLVELCIRTSGRLTETFLPAIDSVSGGADPAEVQLSQPHAGQTDSETLQP